jgi:hypothetical protein
MSSNDKIAKIIPKTMIVNNSDNSGDGEVIIVYTPTATSMNAIKKFTTQNRA